MGVASPLLKMKVFAVLLLLCILYQENNVNCKHLLIETEDAEETGEAEATEEPADGDDYWGQQQQQQQGWGGAQQQQQQQGGGWGGAQQQQQQQGGGWGGNQQQQQQQGGPFARVL